MSRQPLLDPLELVDIYGADAVRLALLRSAAPGNDIPLDEQWIDATRRFGNKLWNAVRFAVEFMDVKRVPIDGGYPTPPGPEDAWILSRLGEVVTEMDRLLDEYRQSDAYGLLYNFAWSEVFDWYLEMAKTISAADGERAATMRQTLGVVLRDLLKLFHPVMPFITEELWHKLPGTEGYIAVAEWPQPDAARRDEDAERQMEFLQQLVVKLRNMRGLYTFTASQVSPVAGWAAQRYTLASLPPLTWPNTSVISDSS